MSAIEQIERVLSLCGEELAACAGEISEHKLLEKERGIYKLGKAIAEINDVRASIYELNPELKPEGWDEPPTDAQYGEWFGEAKRIAEEYCQEGNVGKALSTLESFIFIGPSSHYEDLARKAIEALREKHGI